MKTALKSTNPLKNAKGFSAVKIYETLRREILSLELEPSQLIDEVSLAERFNVSRSPVREALVRLVTESLLCEIMWSWPLGFATSFWDFSRCIKSEDISCKV